MPASPPAAPSWSATGATPSSAYPLTGDEVHRVLRRTTDLTLLAEHREKDLLLDVYGDDPRSVAQRTGLA